MSSDSGSRVLSDGAKAFGEWLKGPLVDGKRTPRRQEDVALALGVVQQTISAWRRGTAIPGVFHRVKLRTLASIAPESWLPRAKQASARLSPEEEREVLSNGTEGR